MSRTQKTPNFNTRILETQILRHMAQTHRKKATLIDEAKNFYRVDELLFRSAQLDGSDAAKLHELGIKSIVNLRHFSRGGDRRAFGDQFWLANKPLQSQE